MERFISFKTLMFVVFCSLATHSTAHAEMDVQPEKTKDYFWAKSDLPAEEFTNYLSNRVCYRNETFFSSCLYGVKAAYSEVNSRLLLLPNNMPTTSYKVDRVWAKNGSVMIYQISGRANTTGLSRRQIVERDSQEKKTFFKLSDKLFKNRDVNFDEMAQQLKKLARKTWPQGADSLIFKSYINPVLGIHDSAARIEPYAWLQYLENLPAQPAANAFESAFPRNTLIVLKDKAIIKRVENGSGADLAGLRQGDELIALNGKRLSQFPIDVLVEEIESREASTISATVKRGYVVFESQITTKSFERPLVSSQRLSHQGRIYHYLRVSTFNNNKTCSDFTRLVSQDRPGSVQGYIIDLRGNGGGILDQATCIAGVLLGPNRIFLYKKDLYQNQKTEVRTLQGPLVPSDIPMVVLVDGNSASASEALAGALRDYSRALLIGQRTYGKGSMNTSRFWDTKKKFVIWKTSAVFYLPSGLTHNRVGIEPDLKVFWKSEATEEENFQTLSEHLDNNPTKPENPTLLPKNLNVIQKVKSCQDQNWIRAEEKRQFGTQLGSDLPLLHALETLRCQVN